MSDEKQIDTANKCLVGRQGDRIVVMNITRAAVMSVDEALNLAAWIVALCYDADPPFADVLAAVEAT